MQISELYYEWRVHVLSIPVVKGVFARFERLVRVIDYGSSSKPSDSILVRNSSASV